MAYSHNARVHKKHRKARRMAVAAFVMFAAVLVGSVIIGVDWLRNQRSTSNTVVSTENTTSVQAANVSVYRSEYFQFQATEDWRQVASESTDKRFVYVKNDNSLITQRLIVYVDRPLRERESDMKITNVVPVTLTESTIETVAPRYLSEHCSESWPDDLRRNPTRITHDNVSFVCAPDSNQYNIIIGEDDGSEMLGFTMSDGREIELTLVYSDLTAYPGVGDLFSLLQSFEVL